MIAIAMSTIVIGAVMVFLFNAERSYRITQYSLDLQMESQVIMEQLSNWIMDSNKIEIADAGRALVLYRIPTAKLKFPDEGAPAAPVVDTSITYTRTIIYLRNGKLYAVFGTSLYGSSDGKSWSAVKDGVKSVIGNGSGSSIVWAVTPDSSIISTSDMSAWKVQGKAPAGFPDSAAVSVDYPLLTNKSILRSVLVAPGKDSLYASVWTINSTDSVWTQIDAPAKTQWRLPVMENLSFIRYDDCLFAFGADATFLRQSNDNGITWYECDSYVGDYYSWNQYMQLPDGFKGYQGAFSYAVDRLGAIWIMTSDGRMWRGAITRLDKRGR